MDTNNEFRILHSYMKLKGDDFCCSKCKGKLVLRASMDEDPTPYFECWQCDNTFTLGIAQMQVIEDELRANGYTL